MRIQKWWQHELLLHEPQVFCFQMWCIFGLHAWCLFWLVRARSTPWCFTGLSQNNQVNVSLNFETKHSFWSFWLVSDHKQHDRTAETVLDKGSSFGFSEFIMLRTYKLIFPYAHDNSRVGRCPSDSKTMIPHLMNCVLTISGDSVIKETDFGMLLSVS